MCRKLEISDHDGDQVSQNWSPKRLQLQCRFVTSCAGDATPVFPDGAQRMQKGGLRGLGRTTGGLFSRAVGLRLCFSACFTLPDHCDYVLCVLREKMTYL